MTAEVGLHSEANLQYLQDNNIDGYVADTKFRKCDPRFADAERHRVRHKEDKRIEDKKKGKHPGCYTNEEFRMAEDASSCQCPTGKTLYRNGERTHTGAYEMVRFRGAARATANRVNSAHSVCALRIRHRRDKWRSSWGATPKSPKRTPSA